MTNQYTYIIFTQHKNSPVNPSETGAIKCITSNEDSAKSIIKDILEKEYLLDKTPIHGVIIRYLNGCLTHAIWTIDRFGYNTTNHLITGFEIDESGIIDKKINIYDLNAKVV